jgi:hypothetical protein
LILVALRSIDDWLEGRNGGIGKVKVLAKKTKYIKKSKPCRCQDPQPRR